MTEQPNLPTSILYTMVRVGDLDRSIAFYQDALGMRELRRETFPGRTFEIESGPDPDRLSIQLFGQSSIAVKDVGYGDELRNGTFARPVVRVHFLLETSDGPVPVREALVIDKENDDTARTLLVPGSVKNGITYWRFDLPRPDPALGSHVLYIEEVDMRRPATYDVEPITVEQLKDEDPFVPSGGIGSTGRAAVRHEHQSDPQVVA